MSIVDKNIRLMEKPEEGGMMFRLKNESWGGWAGDIVVNFHYNRNTGKIIYFGNFQDVPRRIRDDPENVEGQFHFSFKKYPGEGFPKYKIARIKYSEDDTKDARINLSLSAGTFNDLQNVT